MSDEQLKAELEKRAKEMTEKLKNGDVTIPAAHLKEDICFTRTIWNPVFP